MFKTSVKWELQSKSWPLGKCQVRTLRAPWGRGALLSLAEADSTFPLWAWAACWQFLSQHRVRQVPGSVLHPNIFHFLHFCSILFLLPWLGSPAIGMPYTEQCKKMVFFFPLCFCVCVLYGVLNCGVLLVSFFVSLFKAERAQTWFCFTSFLPKWQSSCYHCWGWG